MVLRAEAERQGLNAPTDQIEAIQVLPADALEIAPRARRRNMSAVISSEAMLAAERGKRDSAFSPISRFLPRWITS